MKNKKLSLAVLIMAISAFVSIAVVSCKKDRSERNTNKEQEIQSADNMDDYLISFKEKLLSAPKGGETIGIEQAQRDLGNLLNFTFGDANYATNIFQHDTLIGKLRSTDGQVELFQLAATYEDLASKIRDAYYKINLPEKSVYYISCSFDDTAKDEDLDVILILTTRAYIEQEQERASAGWRSGNRSGTCDGQLVGIWGAPEVVEDLLHNNMGTPSCVNGGRLYYSDNATSYIDSKGPDMQDPNTVSGYKLYHGETYISSMDLSKICLQFSELLLYYNNVVDLFQNYRNSFFPVIPSNRVALQYYLNYREETVGSLRTAYWRLKIDYAKPNCTDAEPEL